MIKDPSKYFYVCDGGILKSQAELKAALKKMPEEVYQYHAQRGDWSNWVFGVLGKKALAEKLKKAGTKKDAEKLLK